MPKLVLELEPPGLTAKALAALPQFGRLPVAARHAPGELIVVGDGEVYKRCGVGDEEPEWTLLPGASDAVPTYRIVEADVPYGTQARVWGGYTNPDTAASEAVGLARQLGYALELPATTEG